MNPIMNNVMKAVLPKFTAWSVKTATRYAVIKAFTAKKSDDNAVLSVSELEQELDEISMDDLFAAGGGNTSEIKKIQGYIDRARSAWVAGNEDEAKEELDRAIHESDCNRCKRGMERVLTTGENVEQNLVSLRDMIPTYYRIMHDEETNQISPLVSRMVDDTEVEEELEVVVVPCETCAATKVLELCNYDEGCMNSILGWVDAQRKDGKSILERDLLDKAREYGGDNKAPLVEKIPEVE